MASCEASAVRHGVEVGGQCGLVSSSAHRWSQPALVPVAGAPTPGTAGEIPKKLSPCARCGVQATEIGADNWAFIIIKTDKKGVVTETTMYGNGCKKC
eukprot:7266114-Pyramimonas_sp.AAC.2